MTDYLTNTIQFWKLIDEEWAQTRIVQGWQYGIERNDADKRHPMFIPCENLPEEEMIYDRNTSVETSKLIIKLGFEIEKK